MLLLNVFVMCTGLRSAALHRSRQEVCVLSSIFIPHAIQHDAASNSTRHLNHLTTVHWQQYSKSACRGSSEQINHKHREVTKQEPVPEHAST